MQEGEKSIAVSLRDRFAREELCKWGAFDDVSTGTRGHFVLQSKTTYTSDWEDESIDHTPLVSIAGTFMRENSRLNSTEICSRYEHESVKSGNS